MPSPREYGEFVRPYVEPDFGATDADAQLPLLSKIGRGPVGHGVVPEVVTDEDGGYSFALVDDETGEVVMRSPNLAAGRVSVTADPAKPVPGETVQVTFHIKRSDASEDYTVLVPSGIQGTRFYFVEDTVAVAEDGVYSFPLGTLNYYGRVEWEDKPEPRVNDCVVFPTSDGIVFSTIEALESDQVVATSQTTLAAPVLSIGDDGYFYVNGESTGVVAKGDKGDDGSQGPAGKDGKDGKDGEKGERGAKGDEGDKGDKGDDGLPALLKIGSVTETTQPQAMVTRTNAYTNEWSIDLGLPRGADGKSVNVQGGIYDLADLPDFDDTEVNSAFVVFDEDDNRYDLYIRGFDPVIAEKGGPWTVVEDFQGLQGYGIRLLPKILIPVTGDEVRITIEEAQTQVVPSKGIQDGDLALDRHGIIGVFSSARDGSGDYVVTYASTLFPHVESPKLLESDCLVDDIRVTVNDLIVALGQAQVLAYDLPSRLAETCSCSDMRLAVNEIIVALQSQGIL